MPVTVSLLKLVSVQDTRALWPEGFAELCAGLEDAPDDRNRMLVIADYLQEDEEPLLEAAFRYVAKRPGIALRKRGDGRYAYWCFDGIKSSVTHQEVAIKDNSTAAGAFAELAQQIDAARRELE